MMFAFLSVVVHCRRHHHHRHHLLPIGSFESMVLVVVLLTKHVKVSRLSDPIRLSHEFSVVEIVALLMVPQLYLEQVRLPMQYDCRIARIKNSVNFDL